MTLRIGLVGMGHWAQAVHAPSLAGSEDVDFVALWGRDAVRRTQTARAFGVEAAESFEALLEMVDIVDFAVPPFVQHDMALRAAAAGKHLLLEKPIALQVPAAEELAAAIAHAGAQSVVFVTRLFDPVRSRWLEESSAREWESAHVEWLSGALVQGGRYDNSRWRHEAGVLWDLGPHVLSQLRMVLGPVTAVAVNSYLPAGMMEVRFRHSRGAESSARMTLHGDPARYTEWIEFGDSTGSTRSPDSPLDYVVSHRRAIAQLIALVRGAASPPPKEAAGYSVSAGLDAVRVLQAVQMLIETHTLSGEFTPVGGSA